MTNSKFNSELYQEMLLDEGCIYDEDIELRKWLEEHKDEIK